MSSKSKSFLAFAISSLLVSHSWLQESWPISIWVGMIFFFWLVPRESALWSIVATMAFGIIGTGISFYWATKTLAYTLNADEGSYVPHVVFAALLLWESIPFAVMGWMTWVQHGRAKCLWMVPAIWVFLECVWPRVFPWSLAHTQNQFLPFIQIAEIGGTGLVSFVFLYACVGISTLLRREDRAKFQFESIVAIALALATCLAGWARLTWLESTTPSKTIRLGVVQIDPSYVESPQRLREASDQLEQPIDLYVWPESTIGTYSTEVRSLSDMVKDIAVSKPPFVPHEYAENLPNWLLVGGRTFQPGQAEEGPFWQTAFLIDKTGHIQHTYSKRHLIPIGEFVPYEKQFPFLHDWAQLSEYIEVGKSDAPVTMDNGLRVGVLICYEDLIESAARRTSMEGAQLLVSLINASAFETPEALEQHRRLSLFRSIENRRCFVRCAGTGVSCFISQTGRELQRLGPMEQGQFVANVPLLDNWTIYQYGGYWLPWLMAMAVVIRLANILLSREPIGGNVVTK
jgi:apolipoprotein N-acyltransferase